MGIQKLEDATVKVIGASQVLTDPATVIKELIDNALDANATVIRIEVHANTLDVIQVRDNGHGIPPEDRTLVATPNCTSKLVDFHDLRDVGGATLGFRGQALASAAELSGSLTISTKVEGEPVCTALKINKNGQVVGQERASLPVGTTVRITDFIKANPVRRQQALKNAEKVLKKTKQMLQAYAFARPHVRLSLKVLKAKNEKDNWVYAPKPNGSLADAALKIVGSACVSQCAWSVVEEDGFTVQALFPKPEAGSTKISGFGPFLSVDGRPLSSSRGTLKRIQKIFRESLSAAGLESVKEPFIYMAIECPSASYDPNVEPAKDDVLFEEPDRLIAIVRKLFGEVYPTVHPSSAKVGSAMQVHTYQAQEPQNPSESRLQVNDGDDGFTTSLEQPYQKVTSQQNAADDDSRGALQLCTPTITDHVQKPHGSDEHFLQRSPQFRTNMYGCDEEDLDLMSGRPPTGRTEADLEELRNARSDVNVSNPWVMAKMNATSRQPMLDTMHETGMEMSTKPRDAEHATDGRHSVGLPTPRPSLPPPPRDESHVSDHTPSTRLARDGRAIGSSSLPFPQAYTPWHSVEREGLCEPTLDQHSPERCPAFGNAPSFQTSNALEGTPLHAIPDASQRTRRSPPKRLQGDRLNRPFVSPVIGPPREKVWFDHLEETGRQKSKQKERLRPYESSGLVRQGEADDSFDESRQSTSPLRNRDIRTWIGSVQNESASSVVERRNYGGLLDTNTSSIEIPESTQDNNENRSPSKGMPSPHGFVPASKLTATCERSGVLEMDTSAQQNKRRKTNEVEPLHERDCNATVDAGDAPSDAEFVPARRASSSQPGHARAKSREVKRTKSSRLPLERVPRGQGMHNVTINLSTSTREVSCWAGRVDEDRSLLWYNQPAVDAYDVFAHAPPDASGMSTLAAQLHELLIKCVSDGEMVQDLGELVRGAFAAREEGEADEDTREQIDQDMASAVPCN
ncbi:hypothetical protein KC343_g5870 [Hortaea werneckii]|uniref:DNA mismatch repair protein S5 domain-containing protein n=1 Tax=Hortaea werneckii TaxID=91943 RepID=A0A3M7DB51_HORWE|nr:hypothetical protein KC352_g16552 [Hortaea werneckii]KAI7567912.1 hypothetical protein KC317_g4655 [Hortaea werneckii]KAI7620045.1 hypothetical protein KC346_g4313 [Hortaea werneckii]KAI7627797.1 hypothetical protein KC343_g5870 [Hortaea werneckii]KAI7676125.1 hypothetical protein KC319_g4447 [Hortaea werneckii]